MKKNESKKKRGKTLKTERHIARAVTPLFIHMSMKYSHNARTAQLFEDIGTPGESHKTNNFNERVRGCFFYEGKRTMPGKEDICMRHVRMRGYAFEVDCARDGRTSGAPRFSA